MNSLCFYSWDLWIYTSDIIISGFQDPCKNSHVIGGTDCSSFISDIEHNNMPAYSWDSEEESEGKLESGKPVGEKETVQ